MMYLLNDDKIKNSRTAVDSNQLNTALNLSYYFKKQRVCSLKLEDVYDGKDILPLIRFDADEDPRPTSEPLKEILQAYIDHLLNGHSVDQNSPLFPVYWEENGKKQLQRDIKKFTDYDKLATVKKYLRTQYSNQLKAEIPDSKSRIKEISKQTVFTERAIAKSLDEGSNPSSSGYLDRGQRFLILLEDMAFLPEIDALDVVKVEKTIENGTYLIKGFERSERNNMMHSLVKEIDDRVREIEKELTVTDQEDALHEIEGKTIKDMLSDLINLNDNHIDEIEQKPSAQKNATPPSMYEPAPPVELTDNMLNGVVKALFDHIKSVRALVSDGQWEKWQQQAKLSSRASSKPDVDSEEDDDLETKLHARGTRSRKISARY